jgi:hypothetical protein
MFRKCFAAVAATMLIAGGLFAEEIKGVFKKFEDNKVTIADADGKETTYKVNTDIKIKATKKDRTVIEIPLTEILAKPVLKDSNVIVTIENGLVTMLASTGKKKSTDKKPNSN